MDAKFRLQVLFFGSWNLVLDDFQARVFKQDCNSSEFWLQFPPTVA
jgi:hypothetical protein